MTMLTERELPWLAAPLHAIRHHERSHALLLHVGEGCGGFELALRVAQSWLCEHPDDAARPCDQCPACHLVRSHHHADLRAVMPEALRAELRWLADSDDAAEGAASGSESGGTSKRKLSSEIVVGAIRQAIDWAHTSSSRGRGKVLVLFPADAMNEIAANALLKTLEEPADGLRLLLCTAEPQRLLPTIRSRCQMVRVPAPDTAQSLAWLRQQGVEGAEVLLHAVGGGQPLRARDWAAAGLSAEVWTQLPTQIAAGDTRGLALLPVPQALQALLRLCHDLMAVNAGGAARFFPKANLPRTLDGVALNQWHAALMRVVPHDDHPWNAGLLLEALVTQGRQLLQVHHRGAAHPRAERPHASPHRAHST
jgi:DNA polymerase-3 subunit delta'